MPLPRYMSVHAYCHCSMMRHPSRSCRCPVQETDCTESEYSTDVRTRSQARTFGYGQDLQRAETDGPLNCGRIEADAGVAAWRAPTARCHRGRRARCSLVRATTAYQSGLLRHAITGIGTVTKATIRQDERNALRAYAERHTNTRTPCYRSER